MSALTQKSEQLAQDKLDRSRDGRRLQLIDATITAIGQWGLSKVTMARVAELAGLSPGIVNFYFASKDELLVETLTFLAEEFDRELQRALARAGQAPRQVLEAVIQVHFDPLLAQPRKISVWNAFWGEAQARERYLKLCGEQDKRIFELLRDNMGALIDRGAAKGQPVGHLDRDALARALIGMIDSLWHDSLQESRAHGDKSGADVCRDFLASVFPWLQEGGRVDQAAPAAGLAAVESLGAEAPGEEADPSPVLSLPGWTYGNDAFFALEKEHLFMPAWHLICHVSDLPNTGDYQTLDLMGERAFVIRGKDGRLRAFHNVCRHRAHAVVTGEKGQCKGAIRCPYHGWAYALDGALKGVPGAEQFQGLDKSKMGLTELELEIYQGFVYVRFRGDGPSVAERMAPLDGELSHYRMAEMVPLGETIFENLEVDWKNIWDNYLEDYHFPTGHPGLSDLMEADYDREVYPTGVSRLSHVLKDAPRRGWSLKRYNNLFCEQDHLPEDLKRRWSYFTFFPGVSFDVYPEHMDFLQVLPVGPGKTLLRYRYYGLPSESRRLAAVRYLNRRINNEVQQEDTWLTRSVQQGLASSSYGQGLLCDREVVLRGFQSWIADRLPVARCAQPPQPHLMAAKNAEMLSR